MARFSINQKIWRWQWLAAVFIVLGAASPVHAAVQEMRVLATGVDRSSAKAAELALDYARKRAVYLVARKMQVEDASSKVAAFTADQMHQIVRGATVLQTRRVGEITYADVTVTVVDDALRKALGMEEVPVNDIAFNAVTRGVLVLPVFVGHDRPYLWEKENAMNDPVRSEVMRQSRGAVLAPAGDFDDRRLVDYQNVLDVKPEELTPMFQRYGIDEIVIAVVTLGDEGTNDASNILLRRLVLKPEPGTRVEEITIKPTSEKQTMPDRETAAAAAVAAAVTNIAGATSEMQQQKLASAPHLPVMFAYANLHELGEMQDAVRNAPGTLQLVMPAIALDNMRGILYLSGDKEEVRKAIAKQGIIVSDEADGWRLSLR